MSVNVYVSDVMFNMDVPENCLDGDIELDYILKDNARMIINMLVDVGAKHIPTVQELLIDYNSRL
jgi:hypothetical protein